MKRSGFSFQSKNFHFIASFLLMMFLVCFQSMFLAELNNSWLRVDLVTVFIVYVAIEHYLLSALIKIVSAAILMQTFSSAPSGFYLMYFLLALVLSGFISRRLVLYNRLSQFIAFAGIFLLKYVLLYFALLRQIQGQFLEDFISVSYPSLIVTILVAVPLFWLFSVFDEFFEFYSLKDRTADIDI